MTMNDYETRTNAIRELPRATPAYVVDETALMEAVGVADGIRYRTGCDILFATKSNSFRPTVEVMEPYLNGLSTSSLFEARAARSIMHRMGKSVHLTSPGIRPDDAAQLSRWCSHIAFNSEEQFEALDVLTQGIPHRGIRLNTRLSFADDKRYDPCRPDSRLGEPVERAPRLFREHVELEGLLIHTNCESTDYNQLSANIGVLISRLGPMLDEGRIKWINLGGGYLFHDYEDNPVDTEPLEAGITYLTNLGVQVFIEPGAALIRSSGNLVASVLEVQERGPYRIAVLDASVNHLPEVYEYQFQPYVHGQLEPDESEGEHRYILAGSTCLAGDVFGTYDFPKPLGVGDRVAVGYIGAYNLVKSHTFNGIALPDIHHLDRAGELTLQWSYDYDEYARRWEANAL